MAGPIVRLASGQSSMTAAAIKWAVECLKLSKFIFFIKKYALRFCGPERTRTSDLFDVNETL